MEDWGKIGFSYQRIDSFWGNISEKLWIIGRFYSTGSIIYVLINFILFWLIIYDFVN